MTWSLPKNGSIQTVQVAMYSMITLFIIGLGVSALFYATNAESLNYDVIDDIQAQSYIRQLTGTSYCYAKSTDWTERVDQRVLDRDTLNGTTGTNTLAQCLYVTREPLHQLPAEIRLKTGNGADEYRIIATTSYQGPIASTQSPRQSVIIDNGQTKTQTTLTAHFNDPIYGDYQEAKK